MPRDAGDTELLIMAVTKAVIAVLLVAIGGYCVVAGVAIPDELVKVVLLVLGAYFGFSAKVYRDSHTNGKELKAWVSNSRRRK